MPELDDNADNNNVGFMKNTSLILASLFMLVLQACSTALPSYPSPFIEQRADPWLLKHDDGFYYFIASVPEFDRIELRRATSIEGLREAPAKVVWRKHDSGPLSVNIWAPELHRIDGQWVIYFAAGEQDIPFKIRMFALVNDAANPLDGEWHEAGQIRTPADTFALDATSFEHQGKRYLLWAEGHPERDYNSALWLAELADVTTLKGPAVVISEPEFDWETRGYAVNEGAAVLKRHGRILVTYSASATDASYAMGLLWIDENANLLEPSQWHKQKAPVFYTDAESHRFGPGHNSFSRSEDDTQDLLVYHARNYEHIEGNPLGDPNRHTHVRVFSWDEDGFPDFRQGEPDSPLEHLQ